MKKRTTNCQQQIAKNQQQIAVMLELLRSAVLDRTPVLDPDVNVDWDDLMDRASKQGILAWVYDGICKLPKEQQLPRQQRINWALSAQEIWDRYHKQKEVLADMVKVCDENGMRMLLLKGIGLSELYPKPESRPSGDIDVYFFDDFKRGNALFRAKKVGHYEKHTEFTYKGVLIENHLRLVDLDTPRRRRANQYFLSYMKESCITKEGYYLLDPIRNLVFLIMHALSHFRHAGAMELSWRSIIDISMFLYQNESVLTKDVCFDIMDELGLAESFELFVKLGEMLLGIDLSEYHRSKVSENELSKAYDVILCGNYIADVPPKLSFSKQFVLQFKKMRQLSWRFRYEDYPSVKRWYMFFKSQVYLLLHRTCH